MREADLIIRMRSMINTTTQSILSTIQIMEESLHTIMMSLHKEEDRWEGS